jgi:hypothetical protein
MCRRRWIFDKLMACVYPITEQGLGCFDMDRAGSIDKKVGNHHGIFQGVFISNARPAGPYLTVSNLSWGRSAEFKLSSEKYGRFLARLPNSWYQSHRKCGSWHGRVRALLNLPCPKLEVEGGGCKVLSDDMFHPKLAAGLTLLRRAVAAGWGYQTTGTVAALEHGYLQNQNCT